MSDSRTDKPVGRVAGLWRYPVKSMAGEALAEVDVPSFANPARPDKSAVIVQTPSGTIFDSADSMLAAELQSGGTRIIKHDRGIFDTFPLSLISTRTIDRLSEVAGVELAVARFRPNILVEAMGEAQFPEDGWLGCILQIGGLRMRVDERDGRCSVITIDPLTAESSPSILRSVTGDRQGCAGVYGTTVKPGRVAVNDAVFIESGGR
ncbi:MAG: MOSC domain-containing protein [Gammaproteobacteria bacterium PRO9]|nr:MOSC domain-containing protein [Gammaproteobacteria bacterium PRO9]